MASRKGNRKSGIMAYCVAGIILCLPFFYGSIAHGQTSEYRIKAGLMERFARFYHMIFVCGNLTRSPPEILAYTGNKPTITVADTDGFGKKGVLINFYLDQNRIRFEINQETLRRSGLKISHHLLGMAKIL